MVKGCLFFNRLTGKSQESRAKPNYINWEGVETIGDECNRVGEDFTTSSKRLATIRAIKGYVWKIVDDIVQEEI